MQALLTDRIAGTLPDDDSMEWHPSFDAAVRQLFDRMVYHENNGAKIIKFAGNGSNLPDEVWYQYFDGPIHIIQVHETPFK